MALQDCEAFAGVEIPMSNSPIPMPRQRLCPHPIDGAAEDVVGIAFTAFDGLGARTQSEIPQPQRIVKSTGKHTSVVLQGNH